MLITEVERSVYTATSKIPGAGQGLFASRPINSGELFVMSPLYIMSEQEWDTIKNTRFAKMMGLQWINKQHAIPLGDIQYKLNSADSEEFSKISRFKNGLWVSPFLLVNHSENPNSQEVFYTSNNMVGLRAVKFIDSGTEITKKYPDTAPIIKPTLDFD